LFGKYNLLDGVEGENLLGIAPTPASQGSNMVIRPEQLLISPHANDNSITGKVVKSTFFGSYYELLVSINTTTTLVVKCNESRYKIGDTVYLNKATIFAYIPAQEKGKIEVL
jgi:hypothetical protein